MVRRSNQRKASEALAERAEEDATAAGLTDQDGRKQISGWALQMAGAAIGEVGEDKEGEPWVEERLQEEGGVSKVRMRYALLTKGAAETT